MEDRRRLIVRSRKYDDDGFRVFACGVGGNGWEVRGRG